MTASTLRLLVLLPFPPRLDATDGGRRVSAELLYGLAQRHPLALLCLRAPEQRSVDPQLRAACDVLHEVALPASAASASVHWFRRARYISGWIAGRPMWATDWLLPAFGQRLQEVVTSWAPDVIQAEYHVMAQYFGVLHSGGAPRVLVEHEPGVTAAYDGKLLGHAYARLVVGLDGLAWHRFERTQMRAVQAVVVFTERDRRALAALDPHAPLVTIPFGTHWRSGPLAPIGSEPSTLVFVGSYRHPPNTDAALWLARSIVPRLRGQHPDVRLTLIGEDPPPELQQLSGPAVAVRGRVPDVAPYLRDAAVVVAPLRLGGGMRVKVLEALAAGKALVASPLAVSGLDVVDGKQVILAESEDEFVEALSRLLGDPARRAALGAQAHAWAQANLGWDQSMACYEQLYRQLVAARQPA